jgi:hypothetical protein
MTNQRSLPTNQLSHEGPDGLKSPMILGQIEQVVSSADCRSAAFGCGGSIPSLPTRIGSSLLGVSRERRLGAKAVWCTRAAHGQLTRGGFVQRVRERVPIANGNRVAVSLDHLPAGPPALAFELGDRRLASLRARPTSSSTFVRRTWARTEPPLRSARMPSAARKLAKRLRVTEAARAAVKQIPLWQRRSRRRAA